MAQKMNTGYLIGGILILAMLSVFIFDVGYVRSGTLAAVCPNCYLDNSIVSGDNAQVQLTLTLEDNSKTISDLNVAAEIYGPDASNMPCKKAIVPGTDIVMDKNIVNGGEQSVGTFSINTAGLETGTDYHLLIYVRDGDSLIDIDNSAGDISLYDECVNRIGESALADPANGCTNVDDKYNQCMGVAWSFDIIPKNETNVSCTSDGERVCTSNSTYSYLKCVDGDWANKPTEVNCFKDQVCQGGECVDNSCTPGDYKEEVCPDRYTPSVIEDKWFCDNDSNWTDNKEGIFCEKGDGGMDYETLAIIGVGLVIIAGAMIIFSRKD